MLESLWPAVLAGILVIAVLASFVLGRRTGASARQVRALKDALATACGERDRSREELEGYRKRVADHFAETSEKLHDLTLQYRDVYDHLARGAGELCPEGFAQLEGGLGLDALPEAEAEAPPASAGAGPEAPEQTSGEQAEAPEPEGQPTSPRSAGF